MIFIIRSSSSSKQLLQLLINADFNTKKVLGVMHYYLITFPLKG